MQRFTKPLIFASLLFSKSIYAQTDTSAKTLNSVVVTGQFKPQTLKNSVYQVKVVTAQRIALSGATNVQQVLNNQLGFRFSTDNALGITDVQVNGMSGRNVKILLDGAPVLDRFDQRVSLSQIDVNTIDHIEIVDGPMAVGYGTDAMAGVINIITKKNYLPGFSVNAKAQEETAGDEYHPFSYKGVHTQNVSLNYKKQNWNFSGGGSHIDFSGFGGDQYGRDKEWLPKEQWLGNAKAGYTNSRFNIYYRLDAVKENIKDRNEINYDIANSLDQQFRTDRFMHQLQGGYQFNKNLQLASTMSYTDFKRSTVTNYHNFINNTNTLGTEAGQQDVSKLNSFSFRNTLQYTVSPKLSLQPGIDINHEKASGERILGAPSIDDYAAFLSAEYKPTDKINIRPGVRFIHNSKYDAPPAVPSLNTKFILNKNLDLRLSYGYGFRAPALRELYFDFIDVNHNIIGNKDLKAETSNSFNGSLTFTKTSTQAFDFSSALGAFYNEFKNQIDLLQNTINPTNPAFIEYTYYNVNKTKTTGFSLDNTFSRKNLQATLGFNYIGYDREYDASLTKTDKRDFLWSPEINSNIIYNLPKIKTSFGFFYKFIGKKPLFSEQTIAGNSGVYLTETSSYNLADFTVTTKVNKYATISGGVKNIFDVTNVASNTIVSSNISHNTGGALSVNYGRSYFLGLSLQWNHK